MLERGMVRWFSSTKGYGFIEFQGEDFFVHYSDIVADGFKSLKTGDSVSFQPEVRSQGRVAKNVALIAV